MEIDLKKHVMYSKRVEKNIKEYIEKQLGKAAVENTFQKVHDQYALFLQDLPYLGGKKCQHNGVGGTYDCIAMFALYEVMETKPTIEELYEMNNETFLPGFRSLGRIVNANHPFFLRIIHYIFQMTAKKDEKIANQEAEGYVMKVLPYDQSIGSRYYFERCPIAEFAKKHGYVRIMPAFCNGDYPAMELMNAALIRQHTCANGDICDYWIVPDQSEFARKYPRKQNEMGYYYNEVKNNE